MAEGMSPPRLTGRTVAILLVLAIALAVAATIYLTRPAAPDAPPADPHPLSYYLARADAVRGEAYFSRCEACHTIAPGGPASIGPNLYGVMGSAIGSRPGFASYSRALRGKGGTWDWESANRFLQSPRAFVPGTNMTFMGVSNPQDRADVMLYLNGQGGVLPMPGGANGSATASAAPAASGITRALLIGRWGSGSCSPPAVTYSSDGSTNYGRRWTLFGDQLIVSDGTRQEQSAVERLGPDRIRLYTRDGPVELTRCPLLPEIG